MILFDENPHRPLVTTDLETANPSRLIEINKVSRYYVTEEREMISGAHSHVEGMLEDSIIQTAASAVGVTQLPYVTTLYIRSGGFGNVFQNKCDMADPNRL